MTSTSPLEEKTRVARRVAAPAQRRGRGAHRRARSSSVQRQARRDGDASSGIRTSRSPPDKARQAGRTKAGGLFADDESRNNTPANRPSAQRADKAAAPRTPQTSCKRRYPQRLHLWHGAPVAEVRETNEGLLINLTDDVNYGMFANGSAEPTRVSFVHSTRLRP